MILAHRGPGGDIEIYSTVARDLRQRIAAENALHAAEAALRQSQKMEAVGRLAGGIAHDFNNLLTIMLGFSDLVITKLGVDHPLRTDVIQIREAGHRAAALTRQLLAFSRRQVVEPRILDPGASVLALEEMLKRLIGEQIALELRLSEHPGMVRVDPSQLELVLINLAVNSRDAMPAGGRLTISTRNADLSPADVADLEGALEASPGAFVCISVADTGTGMDETTRSRIFEPFFTTKPPGRGTGLGLSTVYGIVKQGEGFLSVASAPGHGTEITVYLPRVPSEEEASAANAQAKATQYAGTETILVAEDERAVRGLVTRVLEAHGYQVLAAEDGDAALALSDQYRGTIDLLLSDVIMPGRTGPELAQEIAKRRPGTRVLFMSGYSDQAAARPGTFDSEMALVNKPFSPEELLRRLREVLDVAIDER